MARTGSVWGIDIGQCALKALRCRAHDESGKVVVEAFDYIEYPKILTQPDANPTELVAEALKQFLSRNTVVGDRVAISVSGQSGLARFIKLPPVEAKKIPDIVRYEARQQIPFDLNDVIWDYQRMGGGSEEEGFLLETEIGLFAMKRDAVLRALEPFRTAGIEVDIVQLTPLALYNFVVFDQLRDLPTADQYDPENPPESVVVVSLGTDATDLVVTNGFRVWQRSVPLGGSHFTKALTKELKLTFAKAEHLKRNATTAQDPKAVFQAMRPVFNDMQTELQRSLGYFTNIDRAAKIGRVIALGSAFKLPGLRRYLSQSLGFDVERVDSFHTMSGPEVLANPAFKENMLAFGVCYGLCLQALRVGALRTNLLPKEITRDRIIRQKKPWAVAVAAAVLLAATISFTSFALQLGTATGKPWDAAVTAANAEVGKSTGLKTQEQKAREDFTKTDQIGQHLVSNVQARTQCVELFQAINQCLPAGEDDAIAPNVNESPEERKITRLRQLQVTNIDFQQVDLAKWYEAVKDYAPPAPPSDHDHPDPSGTGTVVQIAGYHYHNTGQQQGPTFVLQTLVANLRNKKMEKLGVSFPKLVKPAGEFVADPFVKGWQVTGAASKTGGVGSGGVGPGGVGTGGAATDTIKDVIYLKRFDFRVQFVWQRGGAQPAPGAQSSQAH